MDHTEIITRLTLPRWFFMAIVAIFGVALGEILK